MNLDELNDALSASSADPHVVLVQFERKRLRRHRRMLAASGGMAVVIVVAVVVGAIVGSLSSGTPLAGASSSAPAGAPVAGSGSGNSESRAPQAAAPGNSAAAGPAKNPYMSANGSGSSGSCAGIPLKQELATAVRQGASVIVATGTLTGKSVTGNPASAGAAAFYAMRLSSVQTLRGPAIGPGLTAWIPGPAPGTSASVTSALLAPGGRLFAIVSPRSATSYPVGPTLRLAPIVGADVVFTPSGCWDLTGLQPSQYQASKQLRSVPDGKPFGGSGQPAENGLYTVPLAAVEQIAAKA
jgi:hypothetical protein